ncbi:hypothetical protein AHAT_10750 [Agarivorans sp. Toyoura001]|uniref:hypothetical protein n=1 Tax=Agarivorans sp. Toyoura001 TaxID=2283141 RepID=UPI0010EAD0BB|nr:hypothetical protein [Agarivorans sp. Toyoura001]GDY25185.1 hypothetical protein AHAT_10750 [Agarivorans sp. Toyoura001]
MSYSLLHTGVIGITTLLLTACSTGYHGSYAERSFYQGDASSLNYIGPASGEHCQTHALYLLPLKQSPSTQLALQQAKQSQAATLMLSDVSISDTTKWRVGYAIQCITVEADAYGK